MFDRKSIAKSPISNLHCFYDHTGKKNIIIYKAELKVISKYVKSLSGKGPCSCWQGDPASAWAGLQERPISCFVTSCVFG